MTEQINSIINLTDTDKTIDELLSEGYQGVNYELIENEGFVTTANHFTDKIQWLKTSPDNDGDIGLMTLDIQAFDELLDFMLDKFGWCPKVYSNKSASEIHIFTPENELEEMAIALTTDGEYGWKGSLYRLAYVEKYQDKIGLIFATNPEDSEQQDWLLVQIDQKNKERSWSVHDGTLEQVYYIMAEEIEIPEPNYNPTPEQIAEAIKGLSGKENDLIEFETTGMITAEKAIELSKAYIKAQEDEDEEKCIAYCQQLNAQKQANNLEYNPEIEDEIIEFPDYLDELIDLLDDEEAVKFHEQIASDLVKEDYTSLYGYDLDQISACSPSYTLKGLLKLWKRTYKAPKLNESCHEAEFYVVDVIPKTYVIIGDAFYFYQVFEGIDDDQTINKDFAMTVLLQYSYDDVDERVNAYQDFEYILPQLVDPEVLDAIILEGFSDVTYSKFNLQKTLENPNLSEESLSFILDFCCGNDLSNYDCYERYEEAIDEEIESLDDDDRISLLKGMIKHPNVTQEILAQLTDSEYEEVAELVGEKMKEFE